LGGGGEIRRPFLLGCYGATETIGQLTVAAPGASTLALVALFGPRGQQVGEQPPWKISRVSGTPSPTARKPAPPDDAC
jgi:hypothetical protein